MYIMVLAGVMREFIKFRTDDAVLRRRTATAEVNSKEGALFEAEGQQLSIIWTVPASKKKYKSMHAIATFFMSIEVMYPRVTLS